MLNSMLVNKDFLTWLLIGWPLCCQPIKYQVWNSLFINRDFDMEISYIAGPRLAWTTWKNFRKKFPMEASEFWQCFCGILVVVVDVGLDHGLALNRQQVISWWMMTKVFHTYCQISNKRHTLVANKIVHHSDVVGASPVGVVPATSSFLT